MAVVFDWCQDVLPPPQSQPLAAKPAKSIEATGSDPSIAATRSRLLAAIALAEHLKEISTRTVEQVVHVWWEQRMAPAIKDGKNVIARDDLYALFEILHAVRDNLNVDLRQFAPGFFQVLPAYALLSYYPATYTPAEGEYRL